MIEVLPLLKVGTRHSFLNFSEALRHTLGCEDSLPISKLDLSVQITFFQSSTSQFSYFFCKDIPYLLLFFVKEWLLDNHTRSIDKFFEFFAYCILTSLGADQLFNFFKSSTAACTYYSSQLSFPIVEDRRSTVPFFFHCW